MWQIKTTRWIASLPINIVGRWEGVYAMVEVGMLILFAQSSIWFIIVWLHRSCLQLHSGRYPYTDVCTVQLCCSKVHASCMCEQWTCDMQCTSHHTCPVDCSYMSGSIRYVLHGVHVQDSGSLPLLGVLEPILYLYSRACTTAYIAVLYIHQWIPACMEL